MPRRPYRLALPQREALQEFIAENVKKGFIRKSTSPIAMGTFLVAKAGAKESEKQFRVVVDFKPVNEIVIDNRNPIPTIDDLMLYLADAKIFTKIDLRGAYNLIRIRPGDEWKTAFVCPQGQYEYTVMPFGLKTAPAIFQGMMSDIFADLLGQNVLIYLDDILIFSRDEDSHVDHVRDVLSRLQEHRLLAKREKCVFHTKQVVFLGYVISDTGVSVSQEKVQTILDWPVPTRRKELKAFLGCASFNRKFIKNFSKIIEPLLRLDVKTTLPWTELWTAECAEAFDAVKFAMTSPTNNIQR